VRPDDDDAYPVAIICAIRSEYDPRTSSGVGGQAAALTCAYVTFNLAAAIREFGYNATRAGEADVEGLAVRAGLGTLDAHGRFVTREFGSRVYLGDAVYTDLPLAVDGGAS
jgi:hypothetical protein